MKKILLIAGLIAVIGAACNTQSNDNNQTPPPPPPPPTSQQPNTQTYTNATYGFQFTYPNSLSFVTPNYSSLQDKIVQIKIPADQYPKTNLVDAAFSVSAQFAKDIDACLKLSPP